MGIKVAKFGGTSLASAEQFRKVQEIITANEERRYIVNSAPGKRHPDDQKITDLLYLCHDRVRQGKPFADIFPLITSRYLEILRELGLSLDLRTTWQRLKPKSPPGPRPITRPVGESFSAG